MWLPDGPAIQRGVSATLESEVAPKRSWPPPGRPLPSVFKRRPVVVQTFAFYGAKHLIANAEAAGNLAPGFGDWHLLVLGLDKRREDFLANWLGQVVRHAV